MEADQYGPNYLCARHLGGVLAPVIGFRGPYPTIQLQNKSKCEGQIALGDGERQARNERLRACGILERERAGESIFERLTCQRDAEHMRDQGPFGRLSRDPHPIKIQEKA